MDIGTVGSNANNSQSTASVISRPSAAAVAISTQDNPSTAVQTADAVRQATSTPSLDQVKQAVQEINKSMNSQSRGLEFTVDDESKQTVVKVIDQKNGEVIRQIPSEEAITIAKSLEQALGNLVKEKA